MTIDQLLDTQTRFDTIPNVLVDSEHLQPCSEHLALGVRTLRAELRTFEFRTTNI